MDNGSEGARQVLLISFAPGIGDTVMMEPLLRATLAALPDRRLVLAARQHAVDLLRPGPYEVITPFYFVERPHRYLRPVHRLIPQRVIALAAETAMSVGFGPFEKVINLFHVWESKVPFNRWWTPQWPLLPGVRHTVDLLAEHLEEELTVQIPLADRVPRLQVFPSAARWAGDYLSAMGVDRRPLAAIVVSAANSLKRWGVSSWAQVNDRLMGDGWRTVLVAPRDSAHARQVFDACDHRPLWPEMDIRQMTAVLDRSDVVAGIDTGPLHVAAGLGRPWVGLFGATNPDLIGPYRRDIGRALVARFPKERTCKHCWLAFKNREDDCLTLPTTGCTALIPVEEVADAVQAVASGTRFA